MKKGKRDFLPRFEILGKCLKTVDDPYRVKRLSYFIRNMEDHDLDSTIRYSVCKVSPKSKVFTFLKIKFCFINQKKNYKVYVFICFST